jgi:hypothetical protein
MRFEAKSLFLGTSLLVAIFLLNIPADARTTMGWNSFRVWRQLTRITASAKALELRLTFATRLLTSRWNCLWILPARELSP